MYYIHFDDKVKTTSELTKLKLDTNTNMNGSLQALVATSKERMSNLKEAAHQKREEVKLQIFKAVIDC